MVGHRTYHPEKHIVTRIYTSKGENILQNLTYHYDGFSNLDARIDNQRNLEETFTYDHLNRLTEIWLGTTKTGWIDYDAYGRMTRKVADNHPVFSNAVYDETTKPHAIDRADTYDGVFTEQSVTYTCFDKVKTVTQGSNTVEYAYGYDRQRIFMEEHTGYGDRTKRYMGNCELLTETTTDGTNVRWLTCLVGPTGAFAMVETDERGNNTLHYILKDNLGSWSVVTDKHGNIEQELSFDAWGNLRNPETWRTWSGMPEPMFDRGFTGHEHLYAFGLINMNGRMYDPQMSSFLSVDAYVQSPENAQGFNRYAYCLNNPLGYTDPSGWLPLGPMPGNPFHDNWSKSFVEPVYEPRDLGKEQLTDYDAIWMQGDEVHGGGGGGDGFTGKPIIDPSELTPEQQESFNSSIKFATENSSLFKKVIDALISSSVSYKILIGETSDGLPAQYNPIDNSITFSGEEGFGIFSVYSEELIHAFQLTECKDLYDANIEFNYEFEAKVIKVFAYYQISQGACDVVGNDSFKAAMRFLSPDGFDVIFPTSASINSNSFLTGYYNSAMYYSEWNKKNNYGNSNYWKATLQKPQSLIRLFH